MAKKVTINGSNLLTSTQNAWGGQNTTQYSQNIHGTTVPPGAEWGMNRGEVERFIKSSINAQQSRVGYYVCDNSASTSAKAVVASGYQLAIGGCIKIKMTNANTANNVTLNINSTGAKAFYYDGAQASATNTWEAGEVLEVYYDGTQYQCASGGGGKFATGEKVKEVSITDTLNDTTALIESAPVKESVDNVLANIGYFVCDTAASTVAKVVAANGYNLTQGGNIRIKMTNANTANNVTLNINSMGAKALYYNGELASAENSWEAGEVLELYYDGESYRCAGSGGLPISISDEELPKEPATADLSFVDDEMNAIVMFYDGHVKTKKFDSNDAVIPEKVLGADFSITDEEDNAIVAFKNGHVKTKNFDSEKLPEDINSTFSNIQNEISIIENELANLPVAADDANKYKYKYQGERIQIAGGMWDEYIIEDTMVPQSLAYYGGYVILVSSNGSVQVYNVAERHLVYSTVLPLSGYHCNSMNFGNEKYDDTDYFPLLYISGEGINVHSIKVFRVQKDASDNFAFDAVQVITMPAPSDNVYPYYPNCFVDCESSKLYIEGYSINSYSQAQNNSMLLLEYALPKLSDGDVSLGTPLSRVVGEFHATTQDGFIKDGKLYQLFFSLPNFTVRKLSDLTMLSYFSLSDLGATYEPEGLDYYQGNAVITCGGNGKIRIIYFK